MNFQQISKKWSIFYENRKEITNFINKYIKTSQPNYIKNVIWNFTSNQNDKNYIFVIQNEPIYDENSEQTLKELELKIWNDVTSRLSSSNDQTNLSSLNEENLFNEQELTKLIQPIEAAGKEIFEYALKLQKQLQELKPAQESDEEELDEDFESKTLDEMWEDFVFSIKTTKTNIENKSTQMSRELTRTKEKIRSLTKTKTKSKTRSY